MLLSDFSCYNPPWLCLQKTLAHLFNKLGSACMTHPQTSLIWQHQWLQCCLRLPSPSLQHSFQQPCSCAWWKSKAEFKGPSSGPSASCRQAESCQGQFPLRECVSNRNRLFLSLFEEERWGDRKDICIYWERHKSHYHLYMIQIIPYSMEVTTAPLSSGSEYVWSHKSTFSSIAEVSWKAQLLLHQ